MTPAATLLTLALALTAGCANSGVAEPRSVGTLVLSSPAFPPGGALPPQYTCRGENRSPPLAWSGVPTEAAALALVVDDQHGATLWTAWNIAPDRAGLPEGTAPSDPPLQGLHETGRIGWHGPCPDLQPLGVRFRLFALDAPLGIPPTSTRARLEATLLPHTLALGELQAITTETP